MSTATDIQVLVVGGRLGGLSCARWLQTAGLDPVVIEREATSESFQGAITLCSDALQLLDRLGVGDAVRRAGRLVTEWTHRRPDGSVTTRLTTTDESGALVIEYGRLCETVAAGLPTESRHMGVTLQALRPTRGGVTAEFANGVREQFDVVIGADGARSSTRAHLDKPGASFAGTTSVAVSLADTCDAVAETWLPDGTVFRQLPTPADGRAVGWLTVPTTVPDTLDDRDAVLECCSPLEWGLADADAAAQPFQTWCAADFRIAEPCFADGRVGLVGDAAHAHHRLTGVGPILALEDGAVLAAELTGRTDAPAARLADYAARRRSRLTQLALDNAAARPLADVESRLAAREPAIPALRGDRLAACFGQQASAPAIDCSMFEE
ncbi:FAD-dependent oxidoreductase [Halosegnis sp.]|uniref:FAD-dependent oxidoreductase n=1 Tax=Halosegnis sp. TaxID=2864959 RepID=UPI0035D4F974